MRVIGSVDPQSESTWFGKHEQIFAFKVADEGKLFVSLEIFVSGPMIVIRYPLMSESALYSGAYRHGL